MEMAVRLSARSILRTPIPRSIPIRPILHRLPTFSAPIRKFTITALRHETLKTITVPPMAESISEGTVGSFHKQIGDYVEVDEEIASIETDKIDVAVTATKAGVIKRLLVGEGDAVVVDQAIVEVDVDAEVAKEIKSEGEIQKVDEPKEEPVQPSQPVQEVSKPVEKPVEQKTVTVTEPTVTAGAFPGYHGSRNEERVKMTRIRKRTASRLKESQNTTAFLTTFNEVDMSSLISLRKTHKDSVFEKTGTKLGFMGPVARASALALKQIPSVNAMIENEDTVVYRDYVDLSVAVATPKGLVTPVLRNIESMGVLDIERGIAALGKKARDGKLTLEDLSGGSFTISNSGIWGSLFGTPIINMPQTAVLGIYGIQERPVAVDGRVEIRPMMYTALTYDHRLIDGREAVIFLTLVKKYLEDPASMLLE